MGGTITTEEMQHLKEKENKPETDVTKDPLYLAMLNDQIIKEGTVPPRKVRGPDGLIIGLEYKYGPDGRINWEEMFDPEYFVYPNNDPTRDPLLKVDGLLNLAEIRGVVSKEVEVYPISETMVAAKVRMEFIPNPDDPTGRVWTGAADACVANIGGSKQYAKYLTTIAETRAAGRCIRGALGIRLCTFEEVSRDDLQYNENDTKPISDELIIAIQIQMKAKGIKEEELMAKIQKKHPQITSLKQLKASQGTEFLNWLNEKQAPKQ